MATLRFRYQAIDATGTSVSGTMAARDRAAAFTTLRARGILATVVEPLTATGSEDPLDAVEPIGWWGRIASGDGAPFEIGLFQLAVMVRNGVNLLTALHVVGNQATYRHLRRRWHALADQVRTGSSLAEAMRRDRHLPELVPQLVRVGEASGNLDQVLERCGSLLRQRRQIIAQQVTALAYPAVVLLAAMGVSAWMVVGVIPALAKFLRSVGRKLPAITQALLDVSAFVTAWLPIIAIVLVAVVAGAIAAYRVPTVRLAIDRLLLRTPVVGFALRTAATALFARTLSVLLRSGVRAVEALHTLSALHRNRYLRQVVDRAQGRILSGSALAPSLRAPGAYTPLLTGMLAIGERSGSLDRVLDEVAEFHEFHLEHLLKRLSTVFEVLTVLVVGGVVGFVYIAFFVALFAAG